MTCQYSELSAYLQLYIRQEFAQGSFCSTDADTYSYFAREAKQGKGKKPVIRPQSLRVPVSEEEGGIVQSNPSMNTSPNKPALPSMQPTAPATNEIPSQTIKPPVQPRPQIQPRPQSPIPSSAIAPPPAAKSAPTTRASGIALDSPSPLSHSPLDDIKSHLSKLFPQLQQLSNPPDDTLAKQRKNRWHQQAQVAILVSALVDEEHTIFLQNVASAVTQKFGPAIVCAASSYQPSPAIRLILLMGDVPPPSGSTPTLSLAPIESYLSQPTEKKALWKQICQALER